MRLFAAIPLSTALTGELSAIPMQLQAQEDGLRWSSAESWHITLQFLGDTPQEQYECIVARLGELRSPRVPVRLGALGFFDRAGVFFAGVDLTPGLVSLQQQVTGTTSLCGFVPETRPYHPHITLARSKAKGKARVRAMGALQARIRRLHSFTAFVAEEFVLYESVPAPGGALYQVRARFPFVAGE